jgi:hypothetical protein
VHNNSKELSSTRLGEQACLSRGVSVSIICISSGFDHARCDLVAVIEMRLDRGSSFHGDSS